MVVLEMVKAQELIELSKVEEPNETTMAEETLEWRLEGREQAKGFSPLFPFLSQRRWE